MRTEFKILTASLLLIALYLVFCIIHTARARQLPICPECGRFATKLDVIDDPFSSAPPVPTYSHRIPPQDYADPFAATNCHWWSRPSYLILWWPFE